jgi:tetratricopeptide (TPR) repeat protein
LARSVPHGTPLSGPAAALFYTQAYGAGANQNAAIRGTAGFWLYRYAQSLRKRDVFLVNWLASVIQNYKSAGLYAFLALAAHNVGQDTDATRAIQQALTLDANAPEVHLVRGILYAAQNDTENARKEYAAAVQTPDAPNWVVSEAKKLSNKGQ